MDDAGVRRIDDEDMSPSAPQPPRLPNAGFAEISTPVGDDVALLAELTADALQHIMQAVIETGRPGCAVAGQTWARRRSLCVAAQGRAQYELVRSSPTPGNVRRRMGLLLLVCDLEHINDLSDALRRLGADARSPLVASADRHQVMAVADAGALRLRAIAQGLPVPTMDGDYLRAGTVLRDAARNLAPRRPQCSTSDGRLRAASCCAAIAEAVLLASRHAAGIAGDLGRRQRSR